MLYVPSYRRLRRGGAVSGFDAIRDAMGYAYRLIAQGFTVLVFFCVGLADFERPPPGKFHIVANSRSAADPQQVHISMVGNDHVRVSWITDDDNVPSTVDYGKSSGVYDSSATGEDTRYSFFLYNSGKIHHVTIGPLEHDTVYYYRCGSAELEFTLKTPPAALPLDFVVVGDLGQTEHTVSTLAQIGAADYDMLLLPGDLSYADTDQPLWDSFGRLVEPVASARPWMVTEGNHEVEAIPVVDYDPFLAYTSRWPTPYENSGSPSNLYYSFEAAGGAVHVVMLGSYAHYGKDSDQYRWLQADLAAVDRRVTPWLLAVLHAPWYNTNQAHQGEGENMRRAMEELLYDARVDIVFAGHVHAYERFTRVYDNAADECGPVHITIGDGGNREGLARHFVAGHKSAHLSVFQEASFGHGRLKVVDEKTAVWSWHRNDDSFATVRDKVVLKSLYAAGACGVGGDRGVAGVRKDEL